MNDDLVVSTKNLSLHYGDVDALCEINLDIRKGKMIGLIGPDGVGKSSLLALISGARKLQDGELFVLGGDMLSAKHRTKVCPDISYMPQGLGRNLYPTLSVYENVDFFARLFDQDKDERDQRIRALLKSTGLDPFADRPAGKLSGGMKQKLGLCCALIHDPQLLILDEPTTGVDPLSRRQFWSLISKIREGRPEMSVLVATAYMEEASAFDWLIMMNDGKVLSKGTTAEILERAGKKSLEESFIELLPEKDKSNHKPIVIDHKNFDLDSEVVIRAKNITKKFGEFTAVNDVSFDIKAGEIYGFLGSNGCGKTTTMKMLTGLLPLSSGEAWLFGSDIKDADKELRRNVGFMTQAFSLYSELTIEQNLELHGRLFSISEDDLPSRVDEMIKRFSLEKDRKTSPNDLPLGVKQRLSLAVALIHRPKILILDEPTSGVDPVARDNFWSEMLKLSREDKVTIFVSTHFMNEAERCDRVAFMHAGKVLETGSPVEIIKKYDVNSLETAFIQVLSKAGAEDKIPDNSLDFSAVGESTVLKRFSFQRLLSYSYRESLELIREPLRLALALIGSVLLMMVMGYGISFDVEKLPVAVLDQDHSVLSRDYIDSLGGSRYFELRSEIKDEKDLSYRMKSGEISLAVEIPFDFENKVLQNSGAEISITVDGSMPMRGETIKGYAQGMHLYWLKEKLKTTQLASFAVAPINIETRYRYNPELKSLISIVPAVIPILLIFIPSMLSVLSVVREKELGSITNMYVTPVTKIEFLLGKQLPYVVIGMVNFFILVLCGILVFGVPLKGSFLALTLATLIYVIFTTGFGLFMSTLTNSQVGAILGTAILSILPAVQFSGLLEPVSSLEGMGKIIGELYPTSYYLLICQGAFSKALHFNDLSHFFPPIIFGALLMLVAGVSLLKKQED